MRLKYRFGKKHSIGVGTSVGVVISIMTSIILAAILTTLTLGETISEEGVTYAVPVVLLISSLFGSFVAGKMVEEKKYLACLITIGAYIFVLIGMTILVFDAAFQSILLNLAMVLIGGGLSILFNIKRKIRTVRKVNSRRTW